MTMNKTHDFVYISKMFDLEDGETVAELSRKIHKALYGYLGDERWNYECFGIYMDHVVLYEYGEGSYYKVPYERTDGNIVFGEKQEVKIQFVPVSSVQMSQNETTEKMKRSALEEHLFANMF